MPNIKFILALCLAALLLRFPNEAAAGASRAMVRWYEAVAPSVFPFLALLPLLTSPEAARAYRRLFGHATSALFRLPGAAASALAVGMAAGTPAGALAARRAAAQSGMNRGQLQRLAVSAIGFSPTFLVGGVGGGLLGDSALGGRLALAQLLTQLTLALLLRRAWKKRVEPVPAADPVREEAPVRGAVLATLTVCGYMALFGALGEVLRRIVGGASLPLLCLMDVPTGAARIAALPIYMEAKLLMLAATCGFGGLCAILQALAALKGCGVRAGEVLALRVLAGAVCAGWTALLTRLGDLRLPGRVDPLAAAGLCACLLAIPALAVLAKNPTLNK